MKHSDLRSLVQNFISSKREDTFYDFKEMYHENSASLLHDIICMANNQTNNDGYIIFGVDDKSYEVVGVINDKNRKRQQDIVTLLRDKKFFANIRPQVELHTISINKKDIDVLIVKNTCYTPYYITQDYCDKQKVVRAFNIYTRICDTNTPIDSSADANFVEHLWRKRFGIDLTPKEKLMSFLEKKENWEEQDRVKYYKYNSEFTVIYEYDDNEHSIPEFYSYIFTDEFASYGHVRLKHYETTLIRRQIVFLDGARFTTVTPHWGYISENPCEADAKEYKYIIRNSEDWFVLQFLHDSSSTTEESLYKKYFEYILLYSSDEEKQDFESYTRKNISILEREVEKFQDRFTYITGKNSHHTEVIKTRLQRALALQVLLKKWRQEIRVQA